MSLATAELPDDPNALRAFALACQGELKAAQTAVQFKTLEIENLKFQIAKLRRMQFGRSSERISRQIEQLELRLDELESGEAADACQNRGNGSDASFARTRPPKAQAASRTFAAPGRRASACRQRCLRLPRLRRQDGQAWRGRQRSAELCAGALRGDPPPPAEICPATPATPSPRPRRRQCRRRAGARHRPCWGICWWRSTATTCRSIARPRSTPATASNSIARRLGDWVGQAAWLLDPVAATIRRHVFAAEKIHGDDTTVPVLAPGLGRTKTGRLWVYVRDGRPFAGDAAPAAAYFYSPDRRGEHPAAHLASFTGLLQADGYAGFEAMYHPARTKPGPITEVACWAHCRRKIFDVWDTTKSPVAKEALDRIAAVYAIEAKARFAPPAERVAHRVETAPLLEAFFAWAEAVLARMSAKSELAEAFRYTIKRRVALSRFVTDGRLEADNNIAENAMRAIAVGRKNYLFAGSDSGGAPVATRR